MTHQQQNLVWEALVRSQKASCSEDPSITYAGYIEPTHLVRQALKVVGRDLVEDPLESFLPLLFLRVVSSGAAHHIPEGVNCVCACVLV